MRNGYFFAFGLVDVGEEGGEPRGVDVEGFSTGEKSSLIIDCFYSEKNRIADISMNINS